MLAASAEFTKATLLPPVVLFFKALYPTAAFANPVVLVVNAS